MKLTQCKGKNFKRKEWKCGKRGDLLSKREKLIKPTEGNISLERERDKYIKPEETEGRQIRKKEVVVKWMRKSNEKTGEKKVEFK